MKLPDRYTLVFVDQSSEDLFTLSRDGDAVSVAGNVSGPEAIDALTAVVLDLTRPPKKNLVTVSMGVNS
jgi:hypothetical protein